LAGVIAVGCAAQARAQAPPAYVISTFAGNGLSGFSGDGGPANGGQLNSPAGVALDSSGALYIADQFNHRLRKVGTDGNISTIAGVGTAGFKGDGAAATAANLNAPLGCWVDSSGNIFLADTGNNVVRKITSSGTISTFSGNYGAGFGFGGDGGNATGAIFNLPSSVAVDSSGNVYISDTSNNRVRKVLASNNTVFTLVGNGSPGYSGDNGAAALARLNAPRGLALDLAGNLYIADSLNHRIRKVAPSGIITTVAGNGSGGFGGDGGKATDAALNRPVGVAVDTAGNIYIADYLNSRVRKVLASGTISTIAGDGRFGNGGDGLYGTLALLNFPSDVKVDSASGKVYIADTQNHSIRMLTPVPAPPSPPVIGPGGVIGAGSFGAFPAAAPGSWIEIYGANLASNTRSWAGSDFNGATAPTVLDNTSVTIGGQLAPIAYISGSQLNVQVPDVGTGPLQVVVNTPGGTSTPSTLTINPTQPGLYAPPSFKIGNLQYAGALFGDLATFALVPGAVPGINSRRAKPGETLVLYGIGFGGVDANIPPGQVAQGPNKLNLPLQILFGQTQGSLTYQGLAPGFVGLYQFNVVVPNVPPNDATPLSFVLGGVKGSQTLYTAIGN
jgi:uncharacterized protein (TIGR03437 family)